MLKKIVTIIALVSLPMFVLAADYKAGTHYVVLDKPISSSRTETIVVNEFLATPARIVMTLNRSCTAGLVSKLMM